MSANTNVTCESRPGSRSICATADSPGRACSPAKARASECRKHAEAQAGRAGDGRPIAWNSQATAALLPFRGWRSGAGPGRGLPDAWSSSRLLHKPPTVPVRRSVMGRPMLGAPQGRTQMGRDPRQSGRIPPRLPPVRFLSFSDHFAQQPPSGAGAFCPAPQTLESRKPEARFAGAVTDFAHLGGAACSACALWRAAKGGAAAGISR